MPHEETVEVHNHDYDDEALVLIVDVEEQPGGQISIAFSREQLAALYGEGK